MFRPRSECIRLPKNTSNKHAEYRYECKMCEEGGWTSETELEIHKTNKHFPRIQKLAMQQSSERTVCLTCVTKLKDSQALLKHIKSEHLLSSEDSKRVEREIFICHHCQQIFFNKDHIEMHIGYKHMGKTIFQCPLCPKKVKASNLWGHFQFHQLQSVSSCPICLTKCSNRLHLKEHIESHRKYYHCSVCDYKTNKEENFEQHRCYVKAKDNNIVNYKKYFLKPKNKSRWIYSVVKNPVKGLSLWNKVFICVLCREICTSNNEMKRHINKDHSLDKQVLRKRHMCLCGEEFFNGLLLKHHVFKMKGSHRVLKEDEKPNPLLAQSLDEDIKPIVEDIKDVPITAHIEDVKHIGQNEDFLITDQTQVVLLPEQTQDAQNNDVVITEQSRVVLITQPSQDTLQFRHNQGVVQTGQPQNIVFSDNTIIVNNEITLPNTTAQIEEMIKDENETITEGDEEIMEENKAMEV